MTRKTRRAYLEEKLAAPASDAARELAAALSEKFSGAAILLYGSGGSVLENASPTDVLFDFYVIAPSYRDAYGSLVMRFANWLAPPNVFYFERESSLGVLRAKYALLSLDHFKKLASGKTFHSYFWARFAQPFRIVAAPASMREALVDVAAGAVDAFVENAAPLVPTGANIIEIWTAGLQRSYKAELRAEQPGRIAQLLSSYGDWPTRVTDATCLSEQRKAMRHPEKAGMWCAFKWRLRAVQGGVLSVVRLLKGAITFDGGVDYIVWKIKRHNGVDVPVREWERRMPILAAPILAARYYRLRHAQSSSDAAKP